MEPGRDSPLLINPYTFPAKLWFLVNTPEVTAITWNSGGDGILIDRALLETQVLSPTCETLKKLSKFRGIKFSSFIRQLHHYGFRKVRPVYATSSCVHHFFHTSFKRDQPELLPEVKRQIRHPAASSYYYNRIAVAGPQGPTSTIGPQRKRISAHYSAQQLNGGKVFSFFCSIVTFLVSREGRWLFLRSVHTHTHTHSQRKKWLREQSSLAQPLRAALQTRPGTTVQSFRCPAGLQSESSSGAPVRSCPTGAPDYWFHEQKL